MKNYKLIVRCLLVVCIAATAFFLSTPTSAKSKGETFSALFYSPSGAGPAMIGSGARVNLDINIYHYTSDAEAQALAKILLGSDGPKNLLKTLQKAKSLGKVRLVGRVGFFDLKLVRSRPMEGGRRIIGVSDRPIQFLEAYYNGRSRDYEFGIVQIDLKTNDKGKEEGEGQMIYAAKIKVLEGNNIDVETYGIQPAKLMGVRKL